MRSKSPTRRVLLIAFAAVVLSFIGATAYSEYRTEAIRLAAERIAGNAIPSIRHLTGARADLREIHRVAEDQVLRTSLGETTYPAELMQAEQRFTSQLDHYFALSTFPHEEELWREIGSGKRVLHASLLRLERNVDDRDVPAAEGTLLHEVGPAADRLAGVLIRDIEFNADRAHESALAVESVRHSGLILAFVLDGLSLVLAVLAGWAALAAIGRYERLVAARTEELDQFSGRMAHDVLSPISAAVIAAAVLEKKAGDRPDLRPITHRITNSLERAGHLVQDLLAFARAAARPSPDARTSIGDVLPGIIAELKPLAAERSVDLEVDAGYSGVVACEVGVLTSLIANLVRNAIKYIGDAPERRVSIRTRLEDLHACFEIEDTGPGLSQDLAAHVFEAFRRGDNPKEPGTGLGLATVKRLAEAHGGAVGVRPAAGKGSIFWFTVPCHRSPSRRGRPAEDPRHHADPSAA